ncbi:MAG: hypothetical protein CSB55_03125 [Candidatus Cloacimonadota bacterium]|nr:MAG: hypothetical protein CSB55_03125 [Candidatus Cloacimonadota bacterium]
MNKKIFIFLSLSAIVLFITSCELTKPEETFSEDWIAVANIDGSKLKYLCKGDYRPYFVPDLKNSEQELLMLDSGNRIDLMNLDGSDRRTIIDSVGSIYRFSDDRTKMLLANNGDIYIADTDGGGLQNLTGTPDQYEGDPAFSIFEDAVIFKSIDIADTTACIAVIDLISLQRKVLFSVPYSGWEYYVSPIFIDESTVIFGQNCNDTFNMCGLYSFNINTGEKKILDSGGIFSRISYNRNKNLLAYVMTNVLKHYNPITYEEVEYGLCYRRFIPNFNRNGTLLAVNLNVYDTETIEMYNLLKNYCDEANSTGRTIDFNISSEKAVMQLSRIFPISVKDYKL